MAVRKALPALAGVSSGDDFRGWRGLRMTSRHVSILLNQPWKLHLVTMTTLTCCGFAMPVALWRVIGPV
jgi:hypothetical protein